VRVNGISLRVADLVHNKALQTQDSGSICTNNIILREEDLNSCYNDVEEALG